MEKKNIYLNPLQQRIFYARARHVRLLAARRFGKTDGSIAPRISMTVQAMPQGTNIWLGNSNKQLLTRTVPGTIAALTRYGWREGQHYWWGRPPKKLGIPEPIIKPKEWSNVISFYNGSYFHLISLAVPGSANSITSNAIVGDECKFMPKKKIDEEVMPTLSGVTHPLGDPRFSDSNPMYKSTFFASDASLTARGNWLEKEEDKLDEPLTMGPFEGRTSRELQKELDAYADKLIRYNGMMYNAKKDGHSLRVCSPEEKGLVMAVRRHCEQRDGAYRILPKPGISQRNLDMLVAYGVIEADVAEKVFDSDYLLTPDEYFELQLLADTESRGYKKYQKHIDALRCWTTAFYRASTIDNISLIGVEYIDTMRRTLPPQVFAISILNMPKTRSADGFYNRLDVENIHGYTPADCPAAEQHTHLKMGSAVVGGQTYHADYETPDFGELGAVKDCTLDGDVRYGLPLYIALDYNALFNCVVTGQIYPNEYGKKSLYTLNSQYVKNNKGLEELMEDWCRYYAPKKAAAGGSREVVFFYDATAKQRAYAIHGAEDFKDTVMRILRKNGWTVTGIDMGVPMAHELKYKEINDGLAGISSLDCRFNIENNEDSLLVAMETADVEIGYKGFRKCKRYEKYKETDSDASDKGSVPYQQRTDITDAWDVLYLGCRHFTLRMSGICLPRSG